MDDTLPPTPPKAPPPAPTMEPPPPPTREEPTEPISVEVTRPVEVAPPSRFRRLLARSGWILLGFFLLLFFTVLKLPEDRIKNYVQGNFAAVLNEQGIGFTASESKVAFGFGVSYLMKDVTLTLPAPANPIKIDKLEVAPSLLPAIFRKIAGKALIQVDDGHLWVSFARKGSQLAVSYEAKALDIRKLGLFPLLAVVLSDGGDSTPRISGGATLQGAGSFSGDLSQPQTMDGNIQLNLAKIVVDEKPMSMPLPKLSISEGKIDLAIEKGKVRLKTFQLGKPGNPADDLQGTVTGDITLAKALDVSVLNLKLNFALSQGVQKASPLLASFLNPGKQPDGSFSYSLTGPASFPNYAPNSAAAPAAPGP